MKIDIKQVVYILVGAIIVIGLGWYLFGRPAETNDVVDTAQLEREDQLRQQLETDENNNERDFSQLQNEVEKSMQENEEETAELSAENNFPSTGIASRLFKEGKFYYKVTVVNPPSVQKGFYLEGWLVNPEGQYFSTGRFMPLETEAVLYYLSDADRSGFSTVLVTLEPEDGNTEPSEYVLKGDF